MPAPRKTKQKASQRWEMLILGHNSKKKEKGSGDGSHNKRDTKAEKGAKGIKAEKGTKAEKKRDATASATYHTPDSIQLNMSEDSDGDLPMARKLTKSSQGSTKDDKYKPAGRATAAERVLSNREKMPMRSLGRRIHKSDKEVELGSEELAEDEDEDEDEEDEEEKDGAPEYNAESLFWVDSDNAEEGDDGLVDPPVNAPPHLPTPSKHRRTHSDSGSEEELSAVVKAPVRKKPKPRSNSDVDDGKDDHGASRPGEDKSAKKLRPWPEEGDSEHESVKAEVRRKQREKEKERAKAKARKEKEKSVLADKPAEKPKVSKAASAGTKLQDSDGRRGASSLKRKLDELIKWGDKDRKASKGEDQRPAPAKKHCAHTQSNNEDDSESEVDDNDMNIDIQYNGKGRPNLREQAPHVQRIARLVIFVVKKNVLLKCAFPDGVKDLQDQARSTLIHCAQEAGYRDMIKRLKDDHQEDYWRKFASLPTQRAFSLRGVVKKITDGAVASVYGVQPGNSEKVEWLQRNLTFIYPHDYKVLQVQSQGKLAFTLPIFESVLRTAFYDNPRSFGYKVLESFESSLLERPHEKEIPASMLTLVATAVYASLDDYRPPKYRTGKFEANIYTPVFKHCISFLLKMKNKQPNKYHALMHGFHQQLTGSVSGVADDNDAFADFSADDE